MRIHAYPAKGYKKQACMLAKGIIVLRYIQQVLERGNFISSLSEALFTLGLASLQIHLYTLA